MPDRSKPDRTAAMLKLERRRQIRGLVFLALGILLLSVARAGLRVVFTPGWWRLW